MSPGLDVQRASYRDGGPERKLLTPGTRYTLRFETLATGNLFRKGHRLRAVLCGSFFPGFSRNLQTGEPEATSSAMRKATITVHGGPSSRLVLPLVP
jgi:predicted acyl esterase